MNIGTLVYHQHSHGNLRLGTIVKKSIDQGGWAQYVVNWHDDRAHLKATDWQTKMRNDKVDRYNITYRADELTPVNPEHLSRALSGYMEGTINRVTAGLKER
tara:strand:+ start:177 stop:482 length:306 start_codon:yes stop_codon:yes gene_type:complete